MSGVVVAMIRSSPIGLYNGVAFVDHHSKILFVLLRTIPSPKNSLDCLLSFGLLNPLIGAPHKSRAHHPRFAPDFLHHALRETKYEAQSPTHPTPIDGPKPA